MYWWDGCRHSTMGTIMDKLLDAIKKYGLRKAVLSLAFLASLTVIGWTKKIDSSHWKDCFETLCYATFGANALEHFAKKKDKEVPATPPVA